MTPRLLAAVPLIIADISLRANDAEVGGLTFDAELDEIMTLAPASTSSSAMLSNACLSGTGHPHCKSSRTKIR